MIKRLSAMMACILILLASFAVPAFADSTAPLVVDNADLLSASEEADLSTKLEQIRSNQNFDIVILTVDSLEGKSVEAYADDFFDYNGYGQGTEQDGCLLLISMEDRDWGISTSGFGIRALTDAGQRYITEQVVPYFSAGDFYGGLLQFADLCDSFVTQAKTGDPYDTDNLPRGPVPIAPSLGAGGILGLIVARLRMGAAKSQLKSKSRKTGAKDYISHDDGAVTLDEVKDTFLFTNVTRVMIVTPKSGGGGGGSTVHTSSSGHTHGGSHGKF